MEQNAATATDRIGRKNWLLIWLIGMAGQICWNVENSWFNNFVYDKIAPNPAIVAWMVGVSAVVSTVCTFLVGTWSDRAGRRKPFVAAGYICWGVFTIVYGLAEFLPKNPVWLAAVFVVCADAVMSFFGSVGNDAGFMAWTTDISSAANRGRLAGALAVMPVIATILGAVVSGMIIDAVDFFPFFIIMGGMVIVIGVFALFAMRDAPTLAPVRDEGGYFKQLLKVFSWRTVRGNRELFWVFIVMLVYFIGFNVYFSYITIYFVNYLGYDYGMAGVLQGGSLVAAALLTFPAGRVIDKGHMVRVILCALAANTVGLLVVAFAGERTVPLILGMFGAGCGYILTLQSLLAWMKNLYPEEQRGQFEGIKQFFFVALPMVFGPAIASPIITRYGLPVVENGVVTGHIPTPVLFVVSAGITALTVLPLLVAGKLQKARALREQHA